VEPQVDDVAPGCPADVCVARVGGWLVISRAWRDGLGRVLAGPAIVAGVFLVTLLAALPLTLRGALQDHLGASLAANDAANGVNYDWWQEFSSQATGIGTTFSPSVIGFPTTLDSVSGLLEARTPVTPIAAALAIYVA